MKRFLIILSLVGSTIFTSSYAAGTKTDPVLTAFQSSFYGAKDVTVEQVGVLYKVSFAINGQYSAAFYNADGELIALTRNMTTVQLPQALQASLKQELNGNWVTDAFAVTIEGESTYYVKLENADAGIMLKSVAGKKWEVYKKNDK